MTLRSVGLFAGVGGLELGLEWAGIEPAAFVELDPYCQRVLAHHWPDVPQHPDVLTFPGWWAEQDLTADVLTAGFPCQPFSTAGRQLGVSDPRWLWPAVAEAIRVVRPRYVLLENVAALTRDADAFGWVLADLHALGFDAEWATVRASDFGAPQNRRRVYLLAHPQGVGSLQDAGMVQGREWGSSLPTGGLLGLAPADRDREAMAWLEREPRLDRLAHGIPAQVDRLRCAGNAAVPRIAQHFGAMIVQHAEVMV